MNVVSPFIVPMLCVCERRPALLIATTSASNTEIKGFDLTGKVKKSSFRSACVGLENIIKMHLAWIKLHIRNH